MLTENAKEVPTIHNFLKQFPWLLDPRIIEFKDEYKYSQILKDTFKEDKLEEKEHDRLSKLDQISLGRLANL